MQQLSVSFAIPNWNGDRYITRCLSSIQHSAQIAGMDFEVVIVDDASEDGGCKKVEGKFKNLTILRNEKNLGFIGTANRAVENCKAPVIILLNNDIVLMKDFVKNIMGHFENNPELFAVSALTVDWETHQPNHAWMSGQLNRNQFQLYWDQPKETCPVMFLQGGAAAIRREYFNQLGGFDPIFNPGYWEDYDLSFRALSHGWKILYEPAAAAYHVGKASFTTRYGSQAVNHLDWRNRFLFCWLNLENFGIFSSLPVQLARFAWKGNSVPFKAFLKAWQLRDQLSEKRTKRLMERKVKQSEIFEPFIGKGFLNDC